MIKKSLQSYGIATLSLLLTMFSIGLANASAATIYGVSTTNQLVRFDSATPGTVTTIATISGLQAAENVLAIDFRPANGQLYALGSTSRLYTVNTLTGAAMAIGSAGAFTLTGTDFGFDFNPTVDRIRLVSNTGQNIRLNPDTGVIAGTDTNLNPGTPSVSAAAYTNNFSGATTTVLYDIDTATDSLFIQNPPNNGTLVSVGALGVDASGVNGFDIATIGGMAFASLNVGGTSRLYTINLTTGAATQVAAIGGSLMLRGLAVANVSAASTSTALDFGGDRRADFASFDLSNGFWTIARSTDTTSFFGFPFGLPSDVVTPGDFDGDSIADATVYRPSNGFWYALRSTTNTVQFTQFGISTDEPVARDYDGDGRTDVAVIRRSANQIIWYILNSSNGSFRAEQFGIATDSVAVGDYDGDGRFDLAVKRGNPGSPATFFIAQSTAGFRAVVFALGEDATVPGDYDGDGRTDIAVIREGSNWTWHVMRSSDGIVSSTPFGTKGLMSVQADYNGDGKTDIATYNPSTATYSVLQSPANTVLNRQLGANTNFPIANYSTY
jgi:Domain of unknown function (DUF4394)/FG-GAP-like repeat